MENIEILSKPIRLPCGLTLQNRITKGPMAEALASKATKQRPNDLHLAAYRYWGEGGLGLIITGNAQVDVRYLGEASDLAIHPGDSTSPEAISRWTALAEASQLASGGGTPTIVQLNHPGRQSVTGYRSFMEKSIAPSAVALNFPGGFWARVLGRLIMGTPRAMTMEDIDLVVQQFVEGAVLMYKAGFKGIQLHAAHGYLICQFLSPKVNERTDEYGGTAEKRLKFLLRIIAAIRAATSPEFCIGVKLNSADFQVMGVDESETLQQVKTIYEAGVDFIDFSGGSYEKPEMFQNIRESTRKREAYFDEFARKAREAAPPGAVVMVTGGFRSRTGMAQAIKSGACDLIGIARPTALQPSIAKDILLNPAVPDESARALQGKVKGPNMGKVLALRAALENRWYSMQIKLSATTGKTNPELRVGWLDLVSG